MNRCDYIGSSDARDIMSGNWLELYNKKMGLIEEENLSDNFKVQLGIQTETFHLDWLQKQLDEKFPGVYCMQLGPHHYLEEQFFSINGICGSHPDAILTEPSETQTLVEVKHSGTFRSLDELCDFYMPQIQHHLYVWGVDHLVFSAIRGNEPPAQIWVERNEDYIEHYISLCSIFWEHVQNSNPPPTDLGLEPLPQKTFDAIKRDGMVRRDISTDNHAQVLINQYKETKEASEIHAWAKKEMKSLMKPDESELYCDDLVLKRNKAGSILFQQPKKERV